GQNEKQQFLQRISLFLIIATVSCFTAVFPKELSIITGRGVIQLTTYGTRHAEFTHLHFFIMKRILLTFSAGE
ncbi:MAG TPA: hypothetical protein VHO43_17490, partial [Ignavibacteriales bacterium]|nr:hypothetical protein [Ignavibacteriales bacterium]